MVGAAWRSLHDEFARWRDVGRRIDFWWRDDDATRRTPELSRLLALAAQANVPLALAVVPKGAEKALLDGAAPGIVVLQHGVDHVNRAGPGEKKTEFSIDERVVAALQRLAAGRVNLEAVADTRSLPILVPPWNRLTVALLPHLAEAGYTGLSTFGARKRADPVPGLCQVNTHVDVIDWKGGRCFAGEDVVLGQAVRHLRMRRTGQADSDEPTGWLTHHAVHDEAAWRFLAKLFETTNSVAGVMWVRPQDAFPPLRA